MSVLEEAPTPRAEFWGHVVRRLDAELTGRVLITGAPPPGGRDLDLVARPPERKVIAEVLASEGFLPRGQRARPRRIWVEQWVAFEGCETFPVDLDPAERWGLPPKEVDALFAEARPIQGSRRLFRPSPQHMLVLATRRFASGGGRLSPKLRERIERALAEAPDAWERAERHAPAWGARATLEVLRDAYVRGGHVPRLLFAGARLEAAFESGDLVWKGRALGRRARAALPAPAVAVAFSGLDGSGKSSQARALARALETARVRVAVHWMPLGLNPSVRLVRRAVKRVLLGSSRRAGHPRPGPGGSGSLMAGEKPALLSAENVPITQAWATVVGLVSASHYRMVLLRHRWRGGVVIFDRYGLDSLAQLRFFYGAHHRFPLQRWLVKTVTPTPIRAYFLDVAPETALARKPEQYDLGQLEAQAALLREEYAGFSVRRIDGEWPIEEACEQIARDVWRALRGPSGSRAEARRAEER